MSTRQLYEGYRWLLSELYDFDNYRARTIAFLMNRGRQIHGGKNIRRGDLTRLRRVFVATLLRGGRRRAWFTLRLLGETLLRRPSVFKEAVSFAVIHQAFHDYMLRLASDLDGVIRDFGAPPDDLQSSAGPPDPISK